jgi:hypothetical protein
MPVSEYYKGSGEKVMSSMKKRYGDKAGERVFYATANKRDMNRPGKKHKVKHSKLSIADSGHRSTYSDYSKAQRARKKSRKRGGKHG